MTNLPRNFKGKVGKNLFLKDKKKRLYLLSTLHDREINLSLIGKQIGAKDLRFADENILYEKLGVKQGCVSAYALINDVDNEVEFLADQDLFRGSELVYFHPLLNTDSTGISSEDLAKFVRLTGHDVKMIKF